MKSTLAFTFFYPNNGLCMRPETFRSMDVMRSVLACFPETLINVLCS